MTYKISRTMTEDFNVVVENLKSALQEQNYLIAAEIDVQSALKMKLDEEIPQTCIICTNTPKVGIQVFRHDPNLGSLLPFSIVVHAVKDNEIEVSAIDPEYLFRSVDSPDMQNLAREVKSVFENLLKSL